MDTYRWVCQHSFDQPRLDKHACKAAWHALQPSNVGLQERQEEAEKYEAALVQWKDKLKAEAVRQLQERSSVLQDWAQRLKAQEQAVAAAQARLPPAMAKAAAPWRAPASCCLLIAYRCSLLAVGPAEPPPALLLRMDVHAMSSASHCSRADADRSLLHLLARHRF